MAKLPSEITDEIVDRVNAQELLAELDAAMENLRKASKDKYRGAKDELRYGTAYQACVKAGLRPQLHRPKHRNYRYSPGHSGG